jgi:hypothetical protein
MSIDPCLMVTGWHFLLALVKAKDARIAKVPGARPGVADTLSAKQSRTERGCVSRLDAITAGRVYGRPSV